MTVAYIICQNWDTIVKDSNNSCRKQFRDFEKSNIKVENKQLEYIRKDNFSRINNKVFMRDYFLCI